MKQQPAGSMGEVEEMVVEMLRPQGELEAELAAISPPVDWKKLRLEAELEKRRQKHPFLELLTFQGWELAKGELRKHQRYEAISLRRYRTTCDEMSQILDWNEWCADWRLLFRPGLVG